LKIIAVTSCPTGIAHTYMAAEALEQAAHAAGHEIFVETQGAAGADPVPPAEIAAAQVVVFAADVEVRGRARFAGKPLVEASVKSAIHDAAALIAKAEAAAASAPSVAAPTGAASPSASAPRPAAAPTPPNAVTLKGVGTRLRTWLMTGVSYMIPFVAAGGLMIALAFMFGGAVVKFKVVGGTYEGHNYAAITDYSRLLAQAGWAGVMFEIGNVAFSMLVPILAGFIAYAIVDRPGIVPGIVSGLIASLVGAGYLGGLIGGLLAGGVVYVIMKLRLPRFLSALMPVLIIPLVSTVIVGGLVFLVVGEPVAAAQRGLTSWLNGLNGTNAALLGAVLGLMMAFDMGGPVNKVAYSFGLAGLASGNLTVMAAVMAAGMTPPIALALATVVRPKLFTPAERKAGNAAWLLGASFITEGAIPFAAADPLRVIPSLMTGSAVTGALSMQFGATSRAPHGGIWVIGLIGHPVQYVIALLAGIVVSAGCVIGAKHIGRRTVTDSADAETSGSTAPAAAPVPVG
jgi:fructose PTS system EIIBC or EIIC component